MRLRDKVLLPVLGACALLLALLLGSWMPRDLRELEAEARSSAEAHLDSIASIFAAYLQRNNPEALYEILDELQLRDSTWAAIELRGPDGSLVYESDSTGRGLLPGVDEIVVTRPIQLQGAELGRLAVKVDVRGRLAGPRARNRELAIAIVVAVIACVALIWLVLERGVRRPLASLAHASARLAAGEFDAPLPRAGGVEVDALVRSFAAMREAIRGYQAELIAKTDSLGSLSAAVDQSPISVVITDREGRVEFANPRFYELTGQGVSETIGRPCALLHGDDLPEPVRVDIRRAFDAGTGWGGEVRRVRAGGEPLQATAFLAPVRDAAGAVAHWLVIMEDVTRQRALEQQLAQAQKMEALGTLAGGIAHDFNNVLSPIIGYTELAREHAAGDPELAEDLAQVSEAALRARDLVRQILTFSRKAEKRKVPLRLATVAEEALRLLRSSIPASIQFHVDCSGEGTILADPTQMHQVVMNLCTNAFHAMEERGGVLSVAVHERDISPEKAVGSDLVPGRHAVLSVSDTGVGMDRQTQARIFDPYFTTKGKGKGTGLGLAVVDGIVRDHGGRVAVYSEPGWGTTFRVYLPLSGAASAPSPQPPPPARPEDVSGHERVLVVDDEESIRSVLGRSLRGAGYDVSLHSNAAEALDVLARRPDACDLLITDMTMPGMNGKELARRAMELRPSLPVILCCGYSSLVSADEALRMGIRRYVEKPIEMHDLLVTVRQVLDSGAGNQPAA